MRLRDLLRLRKLRLRKPDAIDYRPARLEQPSRGLDIVSAWKGHEQVIADLIERFNVPRRTCLEFGVEFGFSTVAFSSYFDRVVGVDTFQGGSSGPTWPALFLRATNLRSRLWRLRRRLAGAASSCVDSTSSSVSSYR